MTESQYTAKVVAFLNDHGALAFKHCDRFTTGIPDVTVDTVVGVTWLEMKMLKAYEEFEDRANEDKIQRFNLTVRYQLHRRAYYVMAHGKNAHIIAPVALDRLLVLKSFSISDYNPILTLCREIQ